MAETAQSQQPLSIQDVCRFAIVSDPQLAPDGRTLAYVRTALDHDRNRYLSQVWLVDTTTGEETRFTNGPKRDTAPLFSPDGRRLAFLSDRAGKNQLYVIDLDGGEARQLTYHPNGVGAKAWSPDGRRLVFAARTGEAYAESKTSDGEPYRPPRRFTRNRYKVDGEGYLDDTRRHLYVVSAGPTEGGKPTQSVQITDGDWDDMHPVWSPDGASIAFASNRTPDREFNTLGDIWLVPAPPADAAGEHPIAEARQLTRSRGPAATPAFSPDGRLVAYAGHERAPLGSGINIRVFVAPTDGSGETRCLTPNLDRSVNNLAMGDIRQALPEPRPLWAPDGSAVYFLAGDRGDTPLWAATVDGATRPIAGGRRSCTAFSVAAESGQIAALIGEPTNPGDIYLIDPTGSQERRLTSANRNFLSERWIGAPEKFSYTGRDGNPLDAWVIRPPGFDPSRKYPLMLKIHGGPHAMYGEGFFHEFQWYAGLGFVVLYTNPRGSQGYGEEHALCIRGEWGDKDYADVMAGVDALLAHGFVDERRLAVGGASYGGYMTSWVIGHTTRFAVAICERPVTNFYSFYGTSDIGFSFGVWETDGLPQRDLERYMRHSPISYVDAVKTPTLIMCGDADHRTPIEQSEQLYISLQRNRVPTEFLRYPDEPHAHAVSGQPRHRTDRLERIEAWLRRHLGSLAPA